MDEDITARELSEVIKPSESGLIERHWKFMDRINEILGIKVWEDD